MSELTNNDLPCLVVPHNGGDDSVPIAGDDHGFSPLYY